MNMIKIHLKHYSYSHAHLHPENDKEKVSTGFAILMEGLQTPLVFWVNGPRKS